MKEQCPDTNSKEGVPDSAYGGGTLVLSQLGENLASTACGGCYHGIVTAGSASGDNSKERDVLMSKLDVTKTLSSTWSLPGNVQSSIVITAPDGHKQDSVRGIVNWFKSAHKITIKDEDVYMFDDRPDNVSPFGGSGFNAQQVSCASRDTSMGGITGACGGRMSEATLKKGVHNCESLSEVVV